MSVNPVPTVAMAARCQLIRDLSGKEVACLGIDVQAARPAPVGKRFGIDKCAEYSLSADSLALLASFGFHSPFVEGSGELVPVGHDPADGVVIFGAIPDHTDDLQGVWFMSVLLMAA